MDVDERSWIDQLTLSDAAGRTILVTLIGVFRREDNLSAFTGESFHGMARVIFQAAPQATRVALVRSHGGTLFFILEVAHRWFDVAAQPVGVGRNARTAS